MADVFQRINGGNMHTYRPKIRERSKSWPLRIELGAALLLKALLLAGLWLLVVHWPERPAKKPDINELFSPPAANIPASADFPLANPQESRHVR